VLSFATGREYVHHEFERPQRVNVSMNLSLIPIDLQPIADKVDNRQRISDAEALQLYRSNDLNALGIMASVAREQRNGNIATYIHNRYINYSNI
jgi:aminodeoxyfutalosine synthase